MCSEVENIYKEILAISEIVVRLLLVLLILSLCELIFFGKCRLLIVTPYITSLLFLTGCIILLLRKKIRASFLNKKASIGLISLPIFFSYMNGIICIIRDGVQFSRLLVLPTIFVLVLYLYSSFAKRNEKYIILEKEDDKPKDFIIINR